MPAIVLKSISILSDAGLGMAMFSLGRYLPPPNFPSPYFIFFCLSNSRMNYRARRLVN
jgi:predicted permease